MVPRLKLSGQEKARAAAAFERYLEDRSSLVKTFALQGLADLGRRMLGCGSWRGEQSRKVSQTGTAAMKARARKLLKELQN